MGLRPPLDVILSWPKPNYVNPETRGNGVLVGTIVLGIITYLVVGGRIWARLFVQRNAGLDDWLVIAAMVSRRAPSVFHSRLMNASRSL